MLVIASLKYQIHSTRTVEKLWLPLLLRQAPAPPFHKHKGAWHEAVIIRGHVCSHVYNGDGNTAACRSMKGDEQQPYANEMLS
ncbi:hypothetical protein F2P81_004605 [Scophthalmus maximus]|uniref:Uncharacterized protein n=1 Tax=Scophthalmus maximus TaxID=52904 RepID=A0A6A4TFR2_SCOMX|nr:hypothetical protein F2P81_004605 [Scophthalmus maximus]